MRLALTHPRCASPAGYHPANALCGGTSRWDLTALPAHLSLDLGVITSVRRVALDASGSSLPSQRISQFTVQCSPDGQSWVNASDLIGTGLPALAYNQPTNASLDVRHPAAEAATLSNR
eukprot:3433027-Prymnesium_polylepis.1